MGLGAFGQACGAGALLLPESTLASATDMLQHLPDSRHVAVYHKGRFFKLWLYEGSRLLKPRDLEMQFQRILDDPSPPQPGEERLAALTAGGRYWGPRWGTRRRGVQSHVPPWSSGRRPDGDVGPGCPVLTRTCRRQEHRWQQQGVAAVTSNCCWLDGGVQSLQTQVLGRALILQGAPLTLPLCLQSGVGAGTPGLLQLWQEQGCPGCHRARCVLRGSGRGVSPLRPRGRGQPQPLRQGPVARQLLQQVHAPAPPLAAPELPPPPPLPFSSRCRWFDKSFTLISFKNGQLGLNTEHAWADAPIIGHLWEVNRPREGPCGAGLGWGGRARTASQPDLPLQFVLGTDSFHLGYTETGHCLGKPNPVLPPPQRLQWDISEQVCGPRRGRGGCVREARA